MPRTQSRIEVTLRDGTVVLGKETKYGPTAKTFANRTQAINAALQHSDGDVIHRGRPFYVRLLESGSTERETQVLQYLEAIDTLMPPAGEALRRLSAENATLRLRIADMSALIESKTAPND